MALEVIKYSRRRGSCGPGIAIRVPQWGAYNEAPEPELLNSFFIDDLRKSSRRICGRSGWTGACSLHGNRHNASAARCCAGQNHCGQTLAPERMPLTRLAWSEPVSVGANATSCHHHAVAEIANGGLVAVNGPPGTGKTTLLRDVVAKVVLDRAIGDVEIRYARERPSRMSLA